MPSKSFNDDNLSRGRNFAKICKVLFPGMSRRLVAAKLGGVSEGSVRNWEKGSTIPNRVLVELSRRGISLEWLLASEGSMFSGITGEIAVQDATVTPANIIALPRPNAARPHGYDSEEREPISFRVVGEAAAYEGGGVMQGAFGEDDRTIWDDVEIPGTTHFVRVDGESMSPVILDGQYAMVGPQYMHGQFPGIGDIVVAEVIASDGEHGGTDAPWEGVYVKRIHDGESCWWFSSINPAYPTFSVQKKSCRLWPVLGVWFAGKGRPPED